MPYNQFSKLINLLHHFTPFFIKRLICKHEFIHEFIPVTLLLSILQWIPPALEDNQPSSSDLNALRSLGHQPSPVHPFIRLPSSVFASCGRAGSAVYLGRYIGSFSWIIPTMQNFLRFFSSLNFKVSDKLQGYFKSAFPPHTSVHVS